MCVNVFSPFDSKVIIAKNKAKVEKDITPLDI
jgi:hypothetical protein